MLVTRITCTRCGQALTVTENAPPRVTCPNCLAALENPASRESGAPPPPLPVLPLDTQVERDRRGVTFLAYGLIFLLLAGTFVTFMGGGVRSGVFVVLLLGGLGSLLFFLGRVAGQPSGPQSYQPVEPSTSPAPGEPVVLDYGRPRKSPPVGATAGGVAAGFFSAIVVCGLGFLVLASTVDLGSRKTAVNHNALILATVVISVVLFMILTFRIAGRWRGFGPGATAGLVLGLMALGPCAACYLMTLG